MADYTPALKQLLQQGGCYFERQGKGVMKYGTVRLQSSDSP